MLFDFWLCGIENQSLCIKEVKVSIFLFTDFISLPVSPPYFFSCENMGVQKIISFLALSFLILLILIPDNLLVQSRRRRKSKISKDQDEEAKIESIEELDETDEAHGSDRQGKLCEYLKKCMSILTKYVKSVKLGISVYFRFFFLLIY